MSQAIRIMTEDEARRAAPPTGEQGFGALSTARGCFPLRAMEVDGRVTGLLAEVALRQTFVNTYGEPLEASYVFPLPDRAAVTGFRLEVQGRVIEGVIKERGAAREEYEQALVAGHRAAITEEERPGVFTMRVGNILPGEEVAVRLTLVGPLPFEEGEATFRFPLVVAPRYIPGVPLGGDSVGDGVAADTDAVPDASRISPPVLLPGYPNPVRLALRLVVDGGGAPLTNLRSTLHVVEEQPGAPAERLQRDAPWSGTGYRVALRPGERLNRDFVLRFGLGDGAVRTGLALRPDAEGNEGTFLLTVVPPASAAAAQRPRDVIFVLDRSGSMGGWKMVAARRAVARMVDTLDARDRFTVYAFDDQIETPAELGGRDLVPASDRNRFRAVEFLARLAERGGTEMAEPLEEAAQKLAGGDDDRDRVLVLVTDGEVGNEDQILRVLAKRIKNVRVFTLGVDRAVNEAFLKRLAALGAGSCEIVESEDRLDEVMAKLHRRIASPVLTELHLDAAGLEVVPGSLVPARAPDLFAGAPLFVLGRFRGPARGALALRARDAVGRPWGEQIAAASTPSGAVAAVWARGQIRQLEDRYVTEDGDKEALERQIVETSLRFGVLSRFTAFVAVDRSARVNVGGEQHHVLQPVEAPEGWAMFQGGAGVGAATPSGFGSTRCGVVASPAMCAAPEPMMDLMECEAAAPSAPAPRSAPLAAKMKAPTPPMRPAMRRPGPSAPAPASPPPRPASPAAPSMLRRAVGGLFGKQDELAGGLPALDLAPYRRRAEELRRSVPAATPPVGEALLLELGRVALRLEEIVEDLRSVDAPAELLAALQVAIDAAKQLVARAGPAVAEVAAAWAALLSVLDDLVAGRGPSADAPAPPTTKSKRSFWK